jgi:hypothetical protein
MRLQYISNDDVTIMDFARQGFPVRYMGILLTGLLHLAYVALPGIAWYGVVLYALNALSLFLWLWLIFGRVRPLWLGGAFVLIVLGYYLRHLAFVDYTATSVLLCSVSLSWAFIAVIERRSGYLHSLALGAVFMLGMLVRPHGALGSLVFTLPLWSSVILLDLRDGPFRERARRLALIALVFLLPAIANFAADAAVRAYTATPEQSQYEVFNSVRGEIHRLNPERKQALLLDHAALQSAGLTAADVRRLYDWYFFDERIYTPEALQTLLQHAPNPQTSTGEIADTVFWRLTPMNPGFLLVFGSWPLFLLAWRKQRNAVLPALLLPLYYPLLTAGMSLLFIFPSRVEHPFVVALGLSALVVGAVAAGRSEDPGSRGYALAGLVGAAIALCGMCLTVRIELLHYDLYARRARVTQDTLQVLNQDFAGSIVLIKPEGGLPLENQDPLHPIDLRFQPVQLGWSTFSPRFYAQIGALGARHGYELMDALINHPDAYVLGSPAWATALLIYATDPDKGDISVVTVRRFADGTMLMRYEKGKK